MITLTSSSKGQCLGLMKSLGGLFIPSDLLDIMMSLLGLSLRYLCYKEHLR